MSEYTTGELAKLCGVSVRTVQFYDSKGILHPSKLTEGGWRIYADEDLKRLQLICLFKSLGLSLDSIKQIMESEYSSSVLLALLHEKEKQLDTEIKNSLKQKDAISAVKMCVKDSEIIPENLNSDIELIMMKNNKKKLTKVHLTMLVYGCFCTLLGIFAVFFWILSKNFIPFLTAMPIIIAICAYLVHMYYKNTAYVCPQCSEIFKPEFYEFFFSRHTPKTRLLTCTHCGKKIWCVETYDER